MKKIVFFFFLFAAWNFSIAQVMEDVLPVSWDISNHRSPSIIEMPPLDLSGIQEEDIINDADKSLPWRYGVTRPIILDFQNSGEWTVLPDGGKIWQVGIRSAEAINVSVNFNEFYLPTGARLHIYNEDRSEVSKTYSQEHNRSSNQLGTWFVTGDVIWVEYYEPRGTVPGLKLEIGSLIHGYRLGRVTQFVNAGRGLEDSGDCNYDVNCPIGNDFDPIKDLVKKAVTLLNLGNGHLCSAALVNNTELDKKPYLLTANHCLESSDPAFWSIRFNWVSPSPICGEIGESGNVQTNFTMSGADVRANNSLSDFALVELYNPVPDSWDVAFAGWDRTDDLPSFEVGIHHPSGDIMKICRDDSGAVRETANGTEVWLIGGVSEGTGDGWEIGTTESGSSGSPLLDQDGRIIGQLYAGQSFCNGTQNNNDYDIYGRFAVSWDAGATPNTRLKDWLDPNDTGLLMTDTMQNLLNVPENEFIGELNIYPNPATTVLTVENSKYPNLTFSFYNTIGQNISSGSLSNSMNTISVETFAKGIYFLHLVDEDSNAEITKKVVVNR